MVRNRLTGFTALALAALTLLSGCAQAAVRPEADTRGYTEAQAKRFAQAISSAQISTGTVATLSAAEDVQGMKKMSESGGLALYLNSETMVFAVKNTATGKVWYSAAGADPTMAASTNARALSMVTLELTHTGQKIVYTSYEHSVKQGTFEVKPANGGFTVVYDMGQEAKITAEDLPQVVEASRFEDKILSSLNESDQQQVLKRYERYSLSDGSLSGAVGEELLKQYPALKTQNLYVLKRGTADFVAQKLYAILQNTAYTYDDLLQDNETYGITLETAPNLRFTIPVTVALKEGQLRVSVDCSALKNTEGYPLTSLTLLEYFGGADKTVSDGYLLLPDGSGTLIDFASAGKSYADITLDVYGRDMALRADEQMAVTEACVLPAFGAKVRQDAYLAVIDQGDALVQISSHTAGVYAPYTAVYSSYRLTPSDRVDAGYTNTSEKRYLDLYQSQPYQGTIAVDYLFLSNDEANYAGMASACRRYYHQKGHLPAASTEKDYPFLLELVGAIDVRDSILGIIPTRSQKALTTFAQAQTMVKTLQSKDVRGLAVRYVGWSNGGLLQTNTATLKPESVLGGKKGLQALDTWLKSQGIMMYADVAALQVNTGKAFAENRDGVRFLGNVTAKVYEYDLATGYKLDDSARAGYLRAPSAFEGYLSSFLSSWNKLVLRGVSLNDTGRLLYSDFNQKQPVNRSQVREQVEQWQSSVAGQAVVMTDTGNAYTWQTSRFINNLPLDSSRYKRTDRAVPFVPMVLHGTAAYAGACVNQSQDAVTAMLRSVEYGAVPSFRWSYAPSSAVKGTDYGNDFSLGWDDWLDTAVTYYHKAAEVLEPVQQQTMTGHEQLTDTLFRTMYEDGSSVYVNYGFEDAVLSDGTVVPARDFCKAA